MRRLLTLIALPSVAFAVFYGCTKEREISGPGGSTDNGNTCLGCHSDQDSLQVLLAGKWDPPAAGREDG